MSADELIAAIRAMHGDPDFAYRCRECRQMWPCNTYALIERSAT